VNRLTRLFIGGVLGDQQEGDKYTGEPYVCHRCFAPRKRYLETADFEAKTMRKVRQRVELAAAGGYLKGRHNSTRVVSGIQTAAMFVQDQLLLQLYQLDTLCTLCQSLFTKQVCCIMSLKE
jgi:hypothetical protein